MYWRRTNTLLGVTGIWKLAMKAALNWKSNVLVCNCPPEKEYTFLNDIIKKASHTHIILLLFYKKRFGEEFYWISGHFLNRFNKICSETSFNIATKMSLLKFNMYMDFFWPRHYIIHLNLLGQTFQNEWFYKTLYPELQQVILKIYWIHREI